MNHNREQDRNIENQKINAKSIKVYMNLLKKGKKKEAEILFQRACQKVKLLRKEDWESRSICGDFPQVDVRCLIFCCRASKVCVLRNAVLRRIGLTVNEYAQMKRKFGQSFERKSMVSSTAPRKKLRKMLKEVCFTMGLLVQLNNVIER